MEWQGTSGPPALTVRAIVTGFLIGAALTPCNVYSGLKIGWSFNMSVPAVLLSYLFWNSLNRWAGLRRWEIEENAIGQTEASSAASIISAGLVAPIPALTLLTGYQWRWSILALWCFVVSSIGVIVAVGIRKQMIVREGLPFPSGIATAETLKEIYARGAEAAQRIKLLLSSALLAGGLKLYDSFIHRIGVFHPPVWSLPGADRLARLGIERITPQNLGIAFDPSLLMIGFGAIVGIRVGISLMIGAILAWVWIGPELIRRGWVDPARLAPESFWYEPLLDWLLWPGVGLMVAAALTSLGLSLGRLGWRKWREMAPPREEAESSRRQDVPLIWVWSALGIAAVVAAFVQLALFGISLWLGFLAVAATVLLAVVAARVSGETGIPPIGALGKVTQVSFGLVAPGSVTTNLMAANVTGGAAGQCSDLLHDLKAGQMVGVRLSHQVVAQCFGVLAGSLAGAAAYLIIIPDPAGMLLTEEWPAPAVATWKAVAEVVAAGFDQFPEGSVRATQIAALVGVALALCEFFCRPSLRPWLPSAASIGFGFILPFSISLGMFFGGLLAWVAGVAFPSIKTRYVLVVAVGLVAGESLAGVAHALWLLLSN